VIRPRAAGNHGVGKECARVLAMDRVQKESVSLGTIDLLRRRWITLLRRSRPRVILADGEEARSIEAACALASEGVLRVALSGRERVIRGVARSNQLRLPRDVDIVDFTSTTYRSNLLEEFGSIFLGREIDVPNLERMVADPLYVSALLVRRGEAQACVGGSTRTTADVIRAAIRVIQLAPGIDTLSSSFLMVLADGRRIAYGDCAVLPYPSPGQLADVAISTAATFERLTGETARVALLSFSSKGSASHHCVERVQHATELARQRAPELEIDGELQFDAAFDERVAMIKAPHSSVAGRANVFVFPSLDSGNIGYKITQRVAKAHAFGPLLQGLARPMNDLSRGCTASEIAAVAVISAVLALEHR
jgi:phosphotransacetylase